MCPLGARAGLTQRSPARFAGSPMAESCLASTFGFSSHVMVLSGICANTEVFADGAALGLGLASGSERGLCFILA